VRFYHFAVIFIAVGLVGCSTANINNIRSVDFSNLTYALPDDLKEPGEKVATFTLNNGTLPATRKADGTVEKMGFSLSSVSYADVTSDGSEEAFVFVNIQTGGSSMPGILYVFSSGEKSPRQLWSIVTGDRADRGFRKIYSENGELVIELNDLAGSQGDCCPTQFSRTKYQLSGNSFRETGRELLPIQSN